ncbi:hypothetical protein SAMN02982917_0152 [Azospirillum oryzae]|uniref:Uncharacterized protein n=1 Tax=Azospirillum oryzae TaxID=286727 RepID=A0A1X7HSC2_9PROT|nr:hypothetical protein [Azospirillum oryzae]SMF91203.1 hypothetical protein SAMN02982917_0152 [Azospirillum oryzae]
MATGTHAAFLNSIRDAAQSRIKTGVFADAAASKAEIEQVGQSIAAKYRGVISAAPIKSEERASQKVGMDYDGDWHSIKDLARMTIIVPTLADCRSVLVDLKRAFTASQGRGLIQVKEVGADADPCGYSSTTVFVRTSNGRPAEIQINVPEIIYAKQSEESVRRILGPVRFMNIKMKYQLDGGLGHALYEIYRVAPASSRGQSAAALSRSYYAFFRQTVPSPAAASGLRKALMDLGVRKH